MKSSISKILIVFVAVLLLCTGGIFLYLKNFVQKDSDKTFQLYYYRSSRNGFFTLFSIITDKEVTVND